MRKLSLLLVLILVLLPVTACSEKGSTEYTLNIVTTIFPQYDFARNIAEGAMGVSVNMLLPPGSESHDFTPSVADLHAISEADIIICVGGETDAWIDNAVEASKSRAVVLRLTDMVPLFEENDGNVIEAGHSHSHSHEGHSHEGGDAHEGGGYDEHVWTSPSNAAVITREICAEMARLSPENSELFNKNTDAYCEKLDEISTEMKSIAENAVRDTLIFADRFPFRYLTEELHLNSFAAFSGCSSDSEPTLSTIYQLTEKAKELNTPVILTAEFSVGAAAEVIAEETGGQVMTLHSCHNVSKEDFNSGKGYLDLMRENLDVLRKALG